MPYSDGAVSPIRSGPKVPKKKKKKKKENKLQLNFGQNEWKSQLNVRLDFQNCDQAKIVIRPKLWSGQNCTILDSLVVKMLIGIVM